MSNDKEKINWSELSDEQKQYIIKATAEMWISHNKKLHREMMDDLLTRLNLTPYEK